jgi:hypothetical protein
LNGDSRETGKLTPTGEPDPSVFSTDFNREGIRLGTAIGLFVRRDGEANTPPVRYRDFWGVRKREELVASLNDPSFAESYAEAAPRPANRFSLRPHAATTDYTSWPRLADLSAAAPLNGMMEKRGGTLIDIDRVSLRDRLERYFDPALDWETFRRMQIGLNDNAARFDAQRTRERAQTLETFEEDRIVRYFLRPFDVRWAYYTPIRPIWNEHRPELWRRFRLGTPFLVIRPGSSASPEGVPASFTRALGDNDALRGHAYYVPLRQVTPDGGCDLW